MAPDLRAHHNAFSALPEPGDEAPFVTAAVALVAELTGQDVSLKALTADLTWSAPGIGLHTASGDDYLVSPEIGGMWVLGPGEGDVWRGLAERDVWRDCSDAETDLLVALYERGLAKLTWDRGIK